MLINPSIYCVIVYYFNVFFPKESEYDISFGEINNKKVIQLQSLLNQPNSTY